MDGLRLCGTSPGKAAAGSSHSRPRFRSGDIPESFPERERLFGNDDWICDGDAVVFEPFGDPIAGPLHRKQEVLYAEIDAARAAAARRSLDVTGHYARPDIFNLTVNRSAMVPVSFSD
jgi:nitrilase